MAKVKYEELVETNFKKPLEEAKLHLDTTVKTISDTYKKIIDDSDLSSIAETRDKWLLMIDSINNKSEELITKMQTKYDEMIEKARKFDGWAADAAAKKSDTPCKVEDDNRTKQIKYFVTETGTDSEGYPTITYKKELRTYTEQHNDSTNPTLVTGYVLGNTPATSTQTYSIKTDDNYTTYVVNSSSISF